MMTRRLVTSLSFPGWRVVSGSSWREPYAYLLDALGASRIGALSRDDVPAA